MLKIYVAVFTFERITMRTEIENLIVILFKLQNNNDFVP